MLEQQVTEPRLPCRSRCQIILTSIFMMPVTAALMATAAIASEDAPPRDATSRQTTDTTPVAMQYPLGVAVAGDGAVLIADRLLPGLWQLANGRLDTLVTGSREFRRPLNAIRAVAVAADGTVYAGDSATREVYKIGPTGEPVGLTGGSIGIPVDIAIDSAGRLFVSDLETQRIWRIDPAVTAPVEVAMVAAPRGLFVDAEDRLWVVAASGTEPLLRLGVDGTITSVVRSQAFAFPHDVVVDSRGFAYVSDNYESCVWRVSPDGTAERWLAGEPLVGPVGLAIREGKILVADPRAKQVFEVDPMGRPTQLVGEPLDESAGESK